MKDLLGILCFIVLVFSVALNAYFVTKCWIESPNWSECKIVFQNENGKETITQDEFLGKVVDFYQSLVNHQIGIIAVVLVLGFIYSYFVSQGQVRRVMDDELYSVHFQEHYLPAMEKHYLPEMEKIVYRLFNDNKTQERLQQLEELYVRVDQLEDLGRHESDTVLRKEEKTDGND